MTVRDLIEDLERCARMGRLGDKTTVIVVRDQKTNAGVLGALVGEDDDGETVHILIDESTA
jgi:hypothetical protein